MTIKEEFHHFIDTIDDEAVLKDYYEIIQTLNDHPANDNPWIRFSDDQKRLVLLSYEESFDEQNLVPHNEVMKKYAKWLG